MFQRKPLRDDVLKEILNRIVDGRLTAGGRINETHLARNLGLSRTPLREAMITLVAQGFLHSIPGRGFSTPTLEAGKFKEIQEVLSWLEPMALNLAPTPNAQTLMELNNLVNRTRLKLGQEPLRPQLSETLLLLVNHWSKLVTATSQNQILVAEISRLQGLSCRYWYFVAEHGFPLEELLASYTQLYELLRSGQTSEACRHWEDQTQRFAGPAADILTKVT